MRDGVGDCVDGMRNILQQPVDIFRRMHIIESWITNISKNKRNMNQPSNNFNQKYLLLLDSMDKRRKRRNPMRYVMMRAKRSCDGDLV